MFLICISHYICVYGIRVTKFPVLQIDNRLHQKIRVELILPTCVTIRFIVFLHCKEELKTVHFSYFHLIHDRYYNILGLFT
jgi:hypothetical protein